MGVLTSHSPTHGGRCRQPDVHVLSTDYHREHLDLLNCHWGGDFLDECLTAVLGCLFEISHASQVPKLSLAYLADRYHKPCTSQVGEFKVVPPFPSGTGCLGSVVEAGLSNGGSGRALG